MVSRFGLYQVNVISSLVDRFTLHSRVFSIFWSGGWTTRPSLPMSSVYGWLSNFNAGILGHAPTEFPKFSPASLFATFSRVSTDCVQKLSLACNCFSSTMRLAFCFVEAPDSLPAIPANNQANRSLVELFAQEDRTVVPCDSHARRHSSAAARSYSVLFD